MIHGFDLQIFPFHNRLIAKIAFLSLNIAKLILGGVKQHARFFPAKLQLAKCCALTSILRTSTFFTCLRLFSFPPRGGPKIKHKLPCDDFPAGVKIFAGCGLLGFFANLTLEIQGYFSGGPTDADFRRFSNFRDFSSNFAIFPKITSNFQDQGCAKP